MANIYDRFSDLSVFGIHIRNGTAVDIMLSYLKKHKGLRPRNLYLEQFKIIGE